MTGTAAQGQDIRRTAKDRGAGEKSGRSDGTRNAGHRLSVAADFEATLSCLRPISR